MDKLYRVTTISGQSVGNVENHYHVLTLHEAKTVIEAWSNAELANHSVSFNMATVEEFNTESGEWEDWMDEEGLGYDETEQMDFVEAGTVWLEL